MACCLACNNIKGDRTPRRCAGNSASSPRLSGLVVDRARGDKSDPRWEPYLALAA